MANMAATVPNKCIQTCRHTAYLLKVGAPKMKILARTTEGDNSPLPPM